MNYYIPPTRPEDIMHSINSGERANHKYVKREMVNGEWRYWYRESERAKGEIHKAQQKAAEVDKKFKDFYNAPGVKEKLKDRDPETEKQFDEYYKEAMKYKKREKRATKAYNAILKRLNEKA